MYYCRSGEEGLYPALLSATEARLRLLKPDASILNRKLCFAQKSTDLAANEHYDDVFNDIAVSYVTYGLLNYVLSFFFV